MVWNYLHDKQSTCHAKDERDALPWHPFANHILPRPFREPCDQSRTNPAKPVHREFAAELVPPAEWRLVLPVSKPYGPLRANARAKSGIHARFPNADARVPSTRSCDLEPWIAHRSIAYDDVLVPNKRL